MAGVRAQRSVWKDPDAVCDAIGERIAELSQTSGDRSVSIALSGGSTPRRLYERLAAAPLREQVRWSAVELFFGDERSVAPEHADSNYRMAREALLDHVEVRVHRMDAEHGEAEAYERIVRDHVASGPDGTPAFDVVLLGMGGDGHTASLFPGTAALDETAKLVVMNEVPQMKTRRMTFTYPLLNAAQRVWVLSTGADKRPRLTDVLGAVDAGRFERAWPITGVSPTRGELVWWLDEAASPA